MNYGFLKRLISFLVVIGIILTFYYFMDLKKEEENRHPNGTGQKVLLKVERRGGECSYGGCYSEIFIYQDGEYLYKEKTQQELKGSFSKEEIKKLGELMSTDDFKKIKSKKFTGQCPVEYDGSELIYTFYQSNGENERIASCEFEVDKNSPLFKHIGELLSKIYLQLSLRM